MSLPGQVYTLELFWDSWEFFGNAALAGMFAGLLLGALGVYVVLRRMVFLSASLSQASSFGVVYAFFLQAEFQVYIRHTDASSEHSTHASNHDGVVGWLLELLTDPLLMSSAMALLVTVLIMEVAKRGHSTENALGFIYLAGAAGTIALAPFVVQEVQDIQSLLLGNAVVVVDEDYSRIVWLTVGVLAIHLVGVRGFVQSSFDSDGARIRGLPVGRLELVLLATLAFSVATCTQVLGALPVFAFSVLPAMAALQLSRNVPTALIVAALLGGLSGFGGYMVAFLFQLSVGASQALFAAGIVVLVVTGKYLVIAVRGYVRHRAQREAQP